MRADALAQQVQLAFAPAPRPLAAIQRPAPPVHGVAEALDFASESRRPESRRAGPRARRPSSPASRPIDGARSCALRRARGLAKVDLLAQARAGIAAGIARQRPAHGRGRSVP